MGSQRRFLSLRPPWFLSSGVSWTWWRSGYGTTVRITRSDNPRAPWFLAAFGPTTPFAVLGFVAAGVTMFLWSSRRQVRDARFVAPLLAAEPEADAETKTEAKA